MLDLLHTSFQIGAGSELFSIHAWDEDRCLCEEVTHLFEWAFGSLWKESPEEDGIGKVADLMKSS